MEESSISILKEFEEDLNQYKAVKEEELGVDISESLTNVVSEDKLREIQISTLNRARKYLSKTFGPMGSNTKIISGNDVKNISSDYSKDGLKVLKNIIFQDPIEASIIEELIGLTRSVEAEVGDGTTSSVVLSSYIFEKLDLIQKKYNIPPYRLTVLFDEAVKLIQEEIEKDKKETTVDDIYDIAMISTNGNEEVSANIKEIYEKFGMDVDLSVGISNTEDSIVKAYDGLTVTEGMSDPAFINKREDNTCVIPNAHVYYFQDPIDSFDMIALFEEIINYNIIDPVSQDEEPTPTVICCPKISRDTENILKNLCTQLYQWDQTDNISLKPPICIVTNLTGSDELIMGDIADLCGCKPIKKYIDPNQKKKEEESGLAATVETVAENFFGIAEQVVSDSRKTKFINPQHMVHYDEEGNMTYDPVYTAMVEFLETELKESKASEDANYVGTTRKRLSALKANMVDYLVGGVTISDRNATKDLVEDAIKNCASAAKDGWGLAANFEGLFNTFKLITSKVSKVEEKFKADLDIGLDILKSIFYAYFQTSKDLYSTVTTEEEAEVVTEKTITDIKGPINIKKGCFDFNVNNDKELNQLSLNIDVKCTITLDIKILNTIAKIISLMVTCNQCLLQAPQLNKY